MPIKPFDITNDPLNDVHEATPVSELPAELIDSLNAAGINAAPVKGSKETKLEHARKTFDAYGATVDKVAQSLASLLDNGSENVKLRTAEVIMRVQGILQEMDDKPAPNITINIHGSENKTLINLVVPQT